MRDSPLHRYAIEQGWYDVDRASNGKYLAKTDADKVAGISDMLPIHSGSHRNYDEDIKNKIGQILQINSIDPSTINSLNQAQTIALINKIENDAQTIFAFVGIPHWSRRCCEFSSNNSCDSHRTISFLL